MVALAIDRFPPADALLAIGLVWDIALVPWPRISARLCSTLSAMTIARCSKPSISIAAQLALKVSRTSAFK
jgi:hypothetical protein